jgi:uncharacterized CHY-type Zn-finger protein
MPNSLRSKLSKLKYEGRITQEEYQDLINKLDGHDQVLRELYKRPKGKWLDSEENEITVICSNCNGSNWKEASKIYKYCPHCGARMESDSE